MKCEGVGGGGVDRIIREDGDGGVTADTYWALITHNSGESGGELQVALVGAGESAISVSTSVASRMVEKAPKLDFVDDFVRGGVCRLSSAGVGRWKRRGLPSSSDDSGVKAPGPEKRVVGRGRAHCAKERVCILVGEARNGRSREEKRGCSSRAACEKSSFRALFS